MTVLSVTSAVFACHSAACAPPPAGRGGSSGGGSFKNVFHARATINKLTAKKRSAEEETRLTAAHQYVKAQKRPATGRDPRNTDDGYDAIRDGFIEKHGVGTWKYRR